MDDDEFDDAFVNAREMFDLAGGRPRRRGGRPLMALTGSYRVERVSGLLPPWGIGKRIQGDRGVTTVLGVPVASFTRVGNTLIYDWLPVRDRLTPEGDGWRGEGVLGDVRFCSFRLRRHQQPRRRSRGWEGSEAVRPPS